MEPENKLITVLSAHAAWAFNQKNSGGRDNERNHGIFQFFFLVYNRILAEHKYELATFSCQHPE